MQPFWVVLKGEFHPTDNYSRHRLEQKTWTTQHEQYGDILCFSCGHSWLPLGGIPSSEVPEWSCGLENLAGFWVNQFKCWKDDEQVFLKQKKLVLKAAAGKNRPHLQSVTQINSPNTCTTRMSSLLMLSTALSAFSSSLVESSTRILPLYATPSPCKDRNAKFSEMAGKSKKRH